MRFFIAFVFLFSVCLSLSFAQSPFSVHPISDQPEVAVVEYDGSMASIADSDTSALKAFSFLSLGKLKEMSAIADGDVSVVFTYRSNQYIVVQLQDRNSISSIPNVWSSVQSMDFRSQFSIDGFKIYKQGRYIFVIDFDDFKVSIVNIKADNIELFKYMVGTFEFAE